MAGALAVAVRIGRRRRAVALGLRAVALEVLRRRSVRSRGRPTRRATPARACRRVADALGVGLHDHARLDLARAGGREHARALELDDADAADVGGPQRLAVAERRRVDAERRAGVEDRRALEHADGLPVDLELDHARAAQERRHAHVSAPFREDAEPADRGLDRARRGLAEAADRRVAHALAHLGDQRELVVDASPRGRPAMSRASASCWRTVPTRHGTHCPQDSSRKKAAMRISIAGQVDRVVEDEDDARAEGRRRRPARPRA